MATTVIAFLLAKIVVTFADKTSSHREFQSTPNILLIMMDDLGFTDTSINAGTFPTPTLEKLASNGIKLNYHYSNTLCSTSRSSLLTGRYAWRNGVNKLIKPWTMQHTDEDLPYISEILKSSKSSKYSTGMWGKWHMGYSSHSFLPFNRGFDHTIFFQSGAIGYTSHKECIPWYWALKGLPIDLDIRNILQNKFIDGLCSYDLWDENYKMVENNGIYSETLYTQNILQYIDNINIEKDNPFLIYYAMQTPHWPLETPPKSYTECDEPFMHNHDHERKVFCNALLYADEMIDNIINKLKDNKLYKNTVIIFLSDNGPNTNWGNKGFGQTLPLRGAKGSTFEGGIRTPAIISGGYVERNCESVIGTSYNNIVHISDWYPIILRLSGNIDIINHIDIDGIDLWDDICSNYDDNIDVVQKRENIIYFSMADIDKPEMGYGPSYIRTYEWKLTVNASLRMDGNRAYQYWVDFDNSFVPHPPKHLYAKFGAFHDELYGSKCYDDYLLNDKGKGELIGTIMKDELDVEGTDFEYDEIMLFRIDEDRIEACNVAKYHPKVVKRLMDQLFTTENLKEYNEFNMNDKMPSKQGALAQIESYNCKEKMGYHLSWNELESYANESLVKLKYITWNDIFNSYIDIVEDCYIKHKHISSKKDKKQIIVILMLLVTTSILLFVMKRYFINKVGKGMNKMEVSDITDITPLLKI